MREYFSIKRKSFKLLLSIFIFVQTVGFMLIPRGVSAQAGAVIVTNPVSTKPATPAAQPVFDWPNYWAQWQIYGQQQAKQEVDQGIGAAAVGALIHAASFYADKMAYDLGDALAHGGKGMDSLIQKYRSGDYFEKVALDAVGDFVKNFSEDALGIGLCQMPDPHLLIQLTLGFKQIYGASPKSDCEWQTLKGNWSQEAFESRYGPGGKNFLAETFSGSLKVSNSDFGVGIEAVAKLNQVVAKKEEAAKAEDIKNRGFKAVVSYISGEEETPAAQVERESSSLTAGFRQQISSTQLAGVMGSGFKQVFVHAGSVFLNTLVGSLMEQALTKCWLDCGSGGDSYESIASGSNLSPLRSRYEDPSNLMNKLITARPTTQINDFDIISEFATCPESPGINNCVIDTNLEKILSMGRNGQPMSIQEALDNGSLDGNMPLISPRREADNTNKNCYLGKLCYSNIQKLRKVRILPLGFEIAALRSDPDNPWKLKDVVAGFENCNRVDANGNSNPNGPYIKEDSAFPYCHLINPNWILRVPPLFCEAKVYTNSLTTPNGPDRQQECVDVKTCINEGENGSCGGYYAYCTKEKNIWRIPGDSCPAEYNTCTAYTNTKTRKQGAFLARTVDYGECSLENTGCRAYSMMKNDQGAWYPMSDFSRLVQVPAYEAERILGRRDNTFAFFDDGMKNDSGVCRQGSAGCTAFYTAKKFEENGQYQKSEGKFIEDTTAEFVYLKKAPDYLGCYDGIKDASETRQWPTNQVEVAVAESASPECSKYASVCTEEEVGCDGFTQMDATNNPQIPGQIGPLNVCDEKCVGYSTFKQESTKFAEEQFPLYFIPKEAESCDAKYVGCDEFTNIESAGQGGEKLEYYTDLKYCEKPREDGSNIKTFYTWEGSIREGLTLRTHKVLPLRQEEVTFLSEAVLAVGNIDGINLGAAESSDMRNAFAVGSPAYGDDTRKAIVDAYRQCNEANYTERINNPYSVNAAEPDCKAFYDDAGVIYYRLLGNEETSANKLVMVDASCHNLRKTIARLVNDQVLHGKSNLCIQKGGVYDAEKNNCQRCINGGRYENNFCVYQTISKPGESMSCQGPANNPGKYNGCRAYTGSTANNLREIFEEENFEVDANATPEQLQAALGSWSPRASLRISPESTDAGKHSLEFSGGNATLSRTVATGTFANDGWYELAFWAKGQGNASITLSQEINGAQAVLSTFTRDSSSGELIPVSFTNDWQAYHLGPVQFVGVTSTEMVINFNFTENQNGRFYIDHVSLTQVRDILPLKEKSWQRSGVDVDAVCDSSPNDGLPGEALGCAAYKDTKQRVRFATGFERLCRQKAIGCEPLWDTYNTITGDDANKIQAFNLLCNEQTGTVDPVTQKCTLDVLDDSSCTIANKWEGSCIISKVSSSNLLGLNADAIIASTIIIPADTPSSTPIFLANRKEFECTDAERGCMVVGLEEQVLSDNSVSSSFRYSDVLVKNDPEKYAETLCRSDLVGCSEYNSSKGLSYFKDPVITGNKICTYREKREGDRDYGWFQDGVGKCSGSEMLCHSKSDCLGGAECIVGDVPCAPDNQDQAGMFDLWSNKTEKYQGFVGSCPTKYNMCTELFDPADTSASNPNGQPYYVIYNKLVTDRSSKCEGKVSLTEGCVLFDKTDEPNKLFNSAATYRASENANPKYSAVVPSTVAFANQPDSIDSNIILKVERDRMCSRWLDCSSKINRTENGKTESVCYAFRECEKISGNICVKWVDDFENDQNIRESQKRLTYFEYVNRGTSWYDVEYTGYSMYDKYRIQNMIYVVPNFEQLEKGGFITDANDFYDVQYIAYVMDSQFFSSGRFASNGCEGKRTWDKCGFDNSGRCYSSSQCIYPIGNVFPPSAIAYADPLNVNNTEANKDGFLKILQALSSNSCKGYPDAKAPFAQDVLMSSGAIEKLQNGEIGERNEFTEKKEGYFDVNVCQTPQDCSCGYKKVYYSDGQSDYYPFEKGPKVDGICSGGVKMLPNEKGEIVLTEMDGYPCGVNADCGSDVAAGAAEDAPQTQSGRCIKINKTETQYGLKGYCLEQDLSRPFGLKNTPYACLTWLPIGVSASSQDIYNTASEAGYVPGENSGKLYCALSTAYNAMPTDMTDDALIRHVNNNFSTYFGVVQGGGKSLPYLPAELEFLGGAVIGGHMRYCNGFPADLDPTTYAGMVCKDFPNAEYGRIDFFSAYIQKWGWENLGHNTILLRSELTVMDDMKDVNTRGPLVSTAGNIQRAASEVIPLALLSRNWSEYTLGTFIHPPRFFGTNVLDIALPTSPRFDYSYFGYSNPALVHQNGNQYQNARSRKVFTASLSPGNTVKPYMVFGEADGSNDDDIAKTTRVAKHSLYRSDLEQRLYEKDIKKVYFVNTAVEGGLDDYSAGIDSSVAPSKTRRNLIPEMFGRDTYIDFDDLRERGSGHDGNVGYVRKSIKATNCWGGYDRNDNPSADGYHGEEFPRMHGESSWIGGNDLSYVNVTGRDLPEDFRALTCEPEAHGSFDGWVPKDFPDIRSWTFRVTGSYLKDNFSYVTPPETSETKLLNGNVVNSGQVFTDERNEIETRYVWVFYDLKQTVADEGGESSYKNLFPGAQTCGADTTDCETQAPTSEQDPFSDNVCSISIGDDGKLSNNYLAIGLDFNAEGEFLGYISKNCFTKLKDYPGEYNIPQLAVFAEVKDQCLEYVKVYDQNVSGGPLTGITNKAWTNRNWIDAGSYFETLPNYGGFIKRYDGIMKHFGSLASNLNSEGIFDVSRFKVDQRASIDEQNEARNQNVLLARKLRQYVFDGPKYAKGVPLSCSDKRVGDIYAHSFEDLNENMNGGNCVSGADEYLASSDDDDINHRSRVDAEASIYQLFAYAFDIYTFDTRKESYDRYTNTYKLSRRNENGDIISSELANTVESSIPFIQDKAKDRPYSVVAAIGADYPAETLRPPQIYSINPVKCRNKTPGSHCTAAEENAMTVNYRNATMFDYDGDGREGDEDVDGDRVPDAIIQNSSISAVVNFFAWADDNRMPIRRVRVDWNDGGRTPITNQNTIGLYKNRKPVCFEDSVSQAFCAADVSKGLGCKDDGDCLGGSCLSIVAKYGNRFGSNVTACEEGYFEFVHDYTCTRGDIPAPGQNPSESKAVYVKQVSDREAIDAKTAEKLMRLGLKPDSYVCVYKPRVQVMDNWEWCNGSCGDPAHPERNTGCYAHAVVGGREIDQCAVNQTPDDPKPWTTYKGSIIVIPPTPLLQAAGVRVP